MRKWFPKPEENYIPGRLLRRNMWNRGKIETPTGKAWVKLPRSMHYERETIATEGAMPGALMYPGPGMHDMYHYVPKIVVPVVAGKALSNGLLFVPTPYYDYPRLQWEFETLEHEELQEGEISVSTPEDLHNVRNNMEGNYKQIADIDMDGWTCPMSGFGWFTPIGAPYPDTKDDTTTTFTGNYNGNGYVIQNIKIARSGGLSAEINQGRRNPSGLFAKTDGSTLKSIYIYMGHLYMGRYGSGYMGAIVGESINTSVQGCIVEQTFIEHIPLYSARALEVFGGSLVGKHTGTGGIVQSAGIGVYLDLFISARVGGLAGSMNGGTLEKCFALSGYFTEQETYRLSIMPPFAFAGERHIGGLVGYAQQATIRDAYITPPVPRWSFPHRTLFFYPPDIPRTDIGGLYKEEEGPYPIHGGIVGTLGEGAGIRNCLMAGCLWTDSETGQNVGSIYGVSSGKTTHSYQDSDISGLMAPHLEFVDEYARPTETLKTWWSKTKNTYIKWDFDNVWVQPVLYLI